MDEKKINKILSAGKATLISTLIFLLITLGLFGTAFYLRYDEIKEPKNLAEISEEEGIYAKLNVTYGPYGFAQDDEDNWYYFVWDENNVMFIVKLTEDTYQKMSNLYGTEGEEQKESIQYEIKGYTFDISSNLKKIAIEAVNEIYKDSDEKVTYSNFAEYLGYVYIDEIEEPENTTIDNCEIFGILAGIMTLILGIITIYQRVRTMKITKNKELMEELKEELANLGDDEYGKLKIYLTSKYIIAKSGGLEVIDYKNVIWEYAQVRYVNGAAQGRTLILCTKDKKRHSVVSTGANDARIDEIMMAIKDKNENLKIGFTKENREFFKSYQKEII